MSSSSYMKNYRTWTVDNVSNGVYTLIATQDGEPYRIAWEPEKYAQSDTVSSTTIDDDGNVVFTLGFVDDKPGTFIRYQLHGEEIHTVSLDGNGGTF